MTAQRRANMGNRTPSGDLFQIARYERRVAVRPLFGIEKLVKIERRKQKGVLFCNSIMSVTDAITFSGANLKTGQYSSRYHTSAPAFLGEPLISAPNEASDADMRRFHDHGQNYLYCFTPENGQTYSIACDIYRPFEANFGVAVFRLIETARIERYSLTLDLSPYDKAGFTVDTPGCQFEALPTEPQRTAARRKRRPQRGARRLIAHKHAEGVWEWRINDVTGGTIRWTWVIFDRDPSESRGLPNFESLAAALSVDSHVAKDLHNFVSLCHYFVANFRSLHAIERKMLANRAVLTRSLESLEQLAGADLIERTKGRGLIRITPAGDAVLEWWSRFYMRWTPIETNLGGQQ